MALLQIRTYPDPILREKAAEVKEFDEDLKRLVRDMAETMYAAPGIGLAANQVGIAKQIVVIDVRNDDGSQTGLLALINPRIVKTEGEYIGEEGCLSLPGEQTEIKRYGKIKVQAQNVEGEQIEMDVEEYLAAVFQHEIDHLNGVLLVDRITPLRRAAMKKRLTRQKKEQAAEAR